jgi:bacteriorhodopsin
MGLLVRGNDALNINPPPGVQRDLTVNGSNWLWAVTAIFIVSFLLIQAHSFVAKSGEKIFHYLYTVSLLVGLISYFAMASDLGWDLVSQPNQDDKGKVRQMFWVKYVYWVVSFPIVSLSLGLMSGVSWATMVYWVGLAWTWVISYLISAFVASNYRWGFFVFGTAAWLMLSSSICVDGFKGAKRVETTKHFTLLMGWTQFLWLFYPLAFGLTDGGNYLGVTPMFIWFGILDILMVPALAFSTVFFAKNWDFGKMNLYFTQYGRVRQGGTFPEKDAPPATGISAA